MNKPVVILDNGAYTAKVGLASEVTPRVVPNCIMKAKSERRRAFIGDQIQECRDASGLFYILCFQRGYLLNWDVQKSIWDYIFSSDCTNINLSDHNLILTEPQMNFASIQEALMEIFFEEYNCAGIYKTTAADMAAYNCCTSLPANCIVVDSGYSFTHVVPIVSGKRIKRGIRRIDVGGKVLTNHLKEIISYRHLNVMDESYVVNQIKEDVCFVSQNFKEDMRVHVCKDKRREVVVDYVLPDFTTVKRGYVCKKRDETIEQQSLRLCNERFTVPELLFNPSDVGINQVGIQEAIVDALKEVPYAYQAELLHNIIVIGGNAMFPGFMPRLEAELRALVPDELKVKLVHVENPISCAWSGGKKLANSHELKDLLLTRDEYEERGYTANS